MKARAGLLAAGILTAASVAGAPRPGRAEEASAGAGPRYAPLAELAWRRLSIGRAGDAMPDRASAMDAWSATVYPVSSWLRLGLGTEWAREASDRPDRDWYLGEMLSLGVQGQGPIAPFFDLSAGAAYLHRVVVSQDEPTFLWSFGASGGVLVHVAGRAFVSVALGWTRPVWLLVDGTAAATRPDDALRQVYTDAFVLRLGAGL